MNTLNSAGAAAGSTRTQFAAASVAELAETARAVLSELAARPDRAAFQELLGMNEFVGHCVATSAQTLAGQMSWAQVGEIAGTSRQNAWARWSSAV